MMTSRRALRMLCATVALLAVTQVSVFVSTASAEEDPHAKHRAMMKQKPKTAATPVSVKINDALLVTQDGKSVHFADDVMADRIVVMDFIYTTCTTVCPVLSTILGRVQNSLGERLGTDVYMVSVSVDPGRDTPERLKAYSERHRARPGWVWLTGEKTSIDSVLRGLGAYTPNFEDHPSMVLVGDTQAGTWTRFFGFPGPDKILGAVEELEMARQVASARQ